ncbi:MAG: trimethylamine methyltransferase family protein [Candidatus Eiseniibacteriota bacterium]|nr:MAG: trimethylamine methyltransferase family protein [Candidatus Eisenbacteria bacterium]
MDSVKVPHIQLLSNNDVERIVEEAKHLLWNTGVFVENDEAMRLLLGAGAKFDACKSRIQIPETLVEKALATCPKRIELFDRQGDPAMDLSGDNTYFDPGSAALKIFDFEKGRSRPPTVDDLGNFARLADYLKNIKAQSTALVPADVPYSMADRLRLYVALSCCTKPVVTGTFVKESFAIMKDMLVAVRGSEEALREKPLAIFDACPSPPLKCSDLTCQSLIDCSKAGIPAELVSMPLSGATSPATLAGTLVQHTAEDLSGIVIHQLACSGSPIIYGGSPAFFDMRKGTTPMGAIETMMIDSSYAQVGKSFGLPTHAYMGLSDSRTVDYQAGLESGLGAVTAILSGVNVVSGVGMMEFENCQSMEKLFLDNDICGMAYRLKKGILVNDETLAREVFREAVSDASFLNSKHTLKWFREEAYFPSGGIDRSAESRSEPSSAFERAAREVKNILGTHAVPPLPEQVKSALEEIVDTDLKAHGARKEWKL